MCLLYIKHVFEMRYVYVYILKSNKFITSIYDYIFYFGVILSCKCNQRGNDLMYKILGEKDIFSPLYGVGEVDKH